MASPNGEVSFTWQGENRAMVFDMTAIAFFERVAGVSIVEALAGLEAARSDVRRETDPVQALHRLRLWKAQWKAEGKL